ncbi:hypothetical protein ACLKA7_001241 [Drosophila subpalustris]
MDADDGLDLDPYSPASNLNTEEMEELLRVEEEILNSPENANEAPKTGKEGRTRLSGAARRRLQHFKAKGLPFEQALALAKQPMQKPCKRLNAESSRKRERSANTTPETNMPKRGGATGAGTIPARVVEVAAESADQQAEKPMTPRPSAATITREHCSYSEVTSAERFAVIPMGYPKALFSTKELSKVQEAILDVIRTQRQGAIKPYFTGCFRPGWLLISCANKETADWLKATVPELKLWTGAKVELVAEANMPKPQVYIGYFPKTEKYFNEDILQLLEGQNRALCIGDWRILNRVDRGKQIELTFSVDPLSDEQLKSVGAEAKNAPAVAMPVSGKAAQTSLDSQELPGQEEGRSWSEKGLIAQVTFVPLSQYTTEDLVAVCAKMPTACGEQEAVIASAYFPGDSNDAQPREVGALVEYCQRENLRWIIGCVANAHHTVWGSTNINNRGAGYVPTAPTAPTTAAGMDRCLPYKLFHLNKVR